MWKHNHPLLFQCLFMPLSISLSLPGVCVCIRWDSSSIAYIKRIPGKAAKPLTEEKKRIFYAHISYENRINRKMFMLPIRSLFEEQQKVFCRSSFSVKKKFFFFQVNPIACIDRCIRMCWIWIYECVYIFDIYWFLMTTWNVRSTLKRRAEKKMMKNDKQSSHTHTHTSIGI